EHPAGTFLLPAGALRVADLGRGGARARQAPAVVRPLRAARTRRGSLRRFNALPVLRRDRRSRRRLAHEPRGPCGEAAARMLGMRPPFHDVRVRGAAAAPGVEAGWDVGAVRTSQAVAVVPTAVREAADLALRDR